MSIPTNSSNNTLTRPDLESPRSTLIFTKPRGGVFHYVSTVGLVVWRSFSPSSSEMYHESNSWVSIGIWKFPSRIAFRGAVQIAHIVTTSLVISWSCGNAHCNRICFCCHHQGLHQVLIHKSLDTTCHGTLKERVPPWVFGTTHRAALLEHMLRWWSTSSDGRETRESLQKIMCNFAGTSTFHSLRHRTFSSSKSDDLWSSSSQSSSCLFVINMRYVVLRENCLIFQSSMTKSCSGYWCNMEYWELCQRPLAERLVGQDLYSS